MAATRMETAGGLTSGLLARRLDGSRTALRQTPTSALQVREQRGAGLGRACYRVRQLHVMPDTIPAGPPPGWKPGSADDGEDDGEDAGPQMPQLHAQGKDDVGGGAPARRPMMPMLPEVLPLLACGNDECAAHTTRGRGCNGAQEGIGLGASGLGLRLRAQGLGFGLRA